MRRDIQFLRGIAVLAVVLYHGKISPIANGYLGVDIFFVISGFLITTIILKGLDEQNFSFSDFYFRRARRLLPALYCTLAITTLVSCFFLTDRQWDDYRAQLYGAISFTSNMVLPFQVGYFEDAADTKPLLHIWSLSLEEQYYFFLPLLLFLTARKARLWVLLLLACASLILCQVFISSADTFDWAPQTDRAQWAFYLFPTRAWELLFGSVAAWRMLKYPQTSIPKSFKVLALFALLVLLCFSFDLVHPRGDALAVVLLTTILILGRDNWLPHNFITRAIERTGDLSYSLYLIHWPLFAFAQVSFLGSVPQSVNLSIVTVSIILSYLQYQYIEQRFRATAGKRKKPALVYLGATTLGLVILSLPAVVSTAGNRVESPINFEKLRRRNAGLSPLCIQRSEFQLSDRCQTSATPRVAIWGDSYAMHLAPGLQLNSGSKDSLVQITRPSCNPGMELSLLDMGLAAARSCVEFNTNALEYLRSSTSIETVVISSPFGYFYEGDGQFLFRGKVLAKDPELAISDLIKTVEALRVAGKNTIIVSPTPHADFNVGDCLERRATGTVIFGRSHCDINPRAHRERQKPVIQALKKVRKETGVRVVWLSDLLCDQSRCRTQIKGLPLYIDQGHLSWRGSRLLLKDARIFPQGD